jgi:hypothetical protein
MAVPLGAREPAGKKFLRDLLERDLRGIALSKMRRPPAIMARVRAIRRARFQGDLPPLQMRICTKYKAPGVVLSDDAPSYPGYPLRLLATLLASRVAMLQRR